MLQLTGGHESNVLTFLVENVLVAKQCFGHFVTTNIICTKYFNLLYDFTFLNRSDIGQQLAFGFMNHICFNMFNCIGVTNDVEMCHCCRG